MFESCVFCPFSKPRKKVNNDMVTLFCLYNDKNVGLIEKEGLKEGRGIITPPVWCPYR